MTFMLKHCTRVLLPHLSVLVVQITENTRKPIKHILRSHFMSLSSQPLNTNQAVNQLC